jgi:ribonuclease inhibitor
MKAAVLNGEKMTSVKEAHVYISRKLDFPEYYGGNLDALWDILSTISYPIHISMTNSEILHEHLGEYSDSLISVFWDAEEENENLSFEII